MNKTPLSGTGFIIWAFVLLVVTTLIPVAVQHWPGQPPVPDLAILRSWAVVTFLADLLAVTVIVLGFGYAITGEVFGIAMSSWNDYSLSKLQMAVWTIVVLAGLMTAAKLNLLHYFPDKTLANGTVAAIDPLGINIPGELLAAMGIAAFSTVATPAILSLKAGQNPDQGEVDAAHQRLQQTTGAAPGTMQNSGKAAGFKSPDAASWLDLVTGDEVANAGVVDLSKVQQLLVTVLLVGTYSFMLVRMFATAASGIETLPALSDRFIELMGISHAGYLAYKAAPKSSQTATAAAPVAVAPTDVPVRLTIDRADTYSGLTVTLDGTPVAIGPMGFVEVSLSPDVNHAFAARGTVAGVARNGTLTAIVTADDVNKPLSITLA